MSDLQKNTELEALLDYIKRSRGFDFTGYKRSTLFRRVNKRMQELQIEGYSNYLDYLEVYPQEFNPLFNTLLINVTSFFRDRPAWDYLSGEVIPRIMARKELGEPLRVWSAGCASGEEAYTIAIVIAQAIGMEQFRERVKIYATDVDEEALNQARAATYYTRELGGLKPEEIEEFFEESDNRYTFRKDLRRTVIFGRHDLIQDAPISKIDLLVCRNTLMYFNSETQSKILARFHFALRDSGFLFLGKAEMLLTHANTFIPVHLKCRVFTKVSKLNLRDRLLLMTQTGNEEATNDLSNQVRLREAAFDNGPIAGIVIDANGLVALVNERARVMFNLTDQDVSRPLQELKISYRPVELRSCIKQAYAERRTINLRDIKWHTSQGETLYLEVQLFPLLDRANNILGINISFIDITRYQRLREELEHSKQELEMAYEEIQSTNEELKTTNEELQLSNEELETTNEELQSTNEELGTMNEELQSTNEELQTVNDQLQRSSEQANQINAFLQSILTSLKGGVVVVDRDLRVQIWNHKAENLWGLRTEEAIGQKFLNLDIGLPVEQLIQHIRTYLSGNPTDCEEVLLQAVNRLGRTILCRITCTALIGTQGQIQGVILLMEEREEEERW
ncbi:MAG TPA: CheR family methyltransferase [Waterburya sp.]|jgi:two-component system CheB/CheR fusion protein